VILRIDKSGIRDQRMLVEARTLELPPLIEQKSLAAVLRVARDVAYELFLEGVGAREGDPIVVRRMIAGRRQIGRPSGVRREAKLRQRLVKRWATCARSRDGSLVRPNELRTRWLTSGFVFR